jgi:uncharacterized protein DUF177 involved in 23S rRNA accumulation
MTAKSDSLDWTVPVKDLARNGVSLSYEADNNELEAIKAVYDLHAAHHFRLEAELRQDQQGIITIKGRLAASVEQNCVVTLAPVAEKMDFDFDRLLISFTGKNRRKRNPDRQRRDDLVEVVVEPLDNDPPDILIGNSIDLGKVALEEFSLELDPYPRHETAPGTAEFSYPSHATEDDTSEPDARPFSVLKTIQPDNSSE